MREWIELSRKTIFEEYGRGIVKIRYRLPDGREEDFFIKHERSFVRILAITKDKKVIAVRKFCAGPGKVFIDLPAGYLIGRESPEQAAERELLNETGYKGRLQFVASTHSDGYCDVIGYLTVATEAEKITEPIEIETEFLEIVIMEISKVRELIRTGGKFTSDVQAWYLGLDYLNLL